MNTESTKQIDPHATAHLILFVDEGYHYEILMHAVVIARDTDDAIDLFQEECEKAGRKWRPINTYAPCYLEDIRERMEQALLDYQEGKTGLCLFN